MKPLIYVPVSEKCMFPLRAFRASPRVAVRSDGAVQGVAGYAAAHLGPTAFSHEQIGQALLRDADPCPSTGGRQTMVRQFPSMAKAPDVERLRITDAAPFLGVSRQRAQHCSTQIGCRSPTPSTSKSSFLKPLSRSDPAPQRHFPGPGQVGGATEIAS